MEDCLMKEWERLKLNDDENFVFGQSSAASTEEGSNTKIALSLVGKLLTQKPFNAEAMKRVLKNLWRIDDNVAIRSVNTNIFVFQFFNIDDRRKVLEGRPWVFDNQILLLKEICAEEQPSDVAFFSCPFWIRLIDMPFGMRSPKVARDIGDCIGECVEVDESDPLCWEEYMRVKVVVDINKPLRRGMKIAVESGCTKWIGFKYERLGDFCYYCGRIGHTDKDCEEKDNCDGESPIVFQYGPFLTASPHRSKVPEAEREKEKRWMERMNTKGRVQRSDYNDPKAIRLGPPSAARKLLFSTPMASGTNSPMPRSISLKAVDGDGNGKMVLRPIAIQGAYDYVPGKDTGQMFKESSSDDAILHDVVDNVVVQAVDMEVSEGQVHAIESKKRRLDATEMAYQGAEVPPKLAHFLWRACKGFLAVRERLYNRHLLVEKCCTICGEGDESVIHATFGSSKTTNEELSSIATLTWAAWWCRNKAIFEHEFPCPISVASNLAKYVHEGSEGSHQVAFDAGGDSAEETAQEEDEEEGEVASTFGKYDPYWVSMTDKVYNVMKDNLTAYQLTHHIEGESRLPPKSLQKIMKRKPNGESGQSSKARKIGSTQMVPIISPSGKEDRPTTADKSTIGFGFGLDLSGALTSKATKNGQPLTTAPSLAATATEIKTTNSNLETLLDADIENTQLRAQSSWVSKRPRPGGRDQGDRWSWGATQPN
uniref:CCHC-type domain-containing protein n=1 Tax=Chenopodium quinoa TaxID=63459 RepID=A0A803M2D0_CHEQI